MEKTFTLYLNHSKKFRHKKRHFMHNDKMSLQKFSNVIPDLLFLCNVDSAEPFYADYSVNTALRFQLTLNLF